MQARPAAEPRPAQHPSSGPSSGHRDGTTTALPAHRPGDQNAEPEARCPLTATPRGVSANKQRRAIEPEAARGQGHSVDRTRRMTGFERGDVTLSNESTPTVVSGHSDQVGRRP